MRRLMKAKELRVAERAYQAWGKEAQVKKACEEVIELANAILHLDGSQHGIDKLAHEIVDVEIMLDQLKIIYDLDPKYLAIQRAVVFDKLERMLDYEKSLTTEE